MHFSNKNFHFLKDLGLPFQNYRMKSVHLFAIVNYKTDQHDEN